MSGRVNNSNSYKQGIMLTETLIGYKGKRQKIEVLSSYEFKAIRMLQQLYQLKRIDGWANEESIFKYIYSLDNKEHRYMMDFTITKGDYIIFVEVKPISQVLPPKKPKEFKGEKSVNSYRNAVATFVKNQDKWLAVREWCNEQNSKIGFEKYKFIIWTENELSIK